MESHDFRIQRNAEAGIGRITFNRPDQLNVMTQQMRYDLSDLVESLGAEPWMRVLIVDAAGERAFSAGADVGEFLSLTALEQSRLHYFASAPERIPQPVIVAIDGHCYGGPFEMSLACDFRIVTPRARLGLPEVRMGQMPGSGGGQRLLRLIGMTRTKLMCLTGLRIDGKTAAEWGLATMCVEPAQLEAEVDRLAADLASLAPHAVQMIKRALDMGADAPLVTALELEGKMYATLKSTADYREGVQAFQEKRTPVFRGE